MPRKKKDEQPLAAAEREAEAHAESAADLADTPVLDVDAGAADEARTEVITDTDPVVSAEDAAIHSDTETAKEASGDIDAAQKPAKVKKTIGSGRPKQRSIKYQAAAGAVDATKSYALEAAIELAKQTSYTKFDGTLAVHVRLAAKKGKGDSDAIRGLLQLPHGSGKTINAVILTEELIDEIAKDKSTKYDVLIAPRSLMAKVAKIAKVLGPQGKMPSPKAGTVTDTPEDTLKSIQSGRVEYRADAGGNVHQAIGKVSWETSKLVENIQAVIGSLPAAQLRSVTLAATMSPGIHVDLSTLTR